MPLYAIGNVNDRSYYPYSPAYYQEYGVGKINLKKAIQDIGKGIKHTADDVAMAMKKVSLAVPRGAFLGMMKLNGLNSAHNLGIAWNRGHRSAILEHWRRVGGKEKDFIIALNMGIKHWNATKHAKKLHSHIELVSGYGSAHIGYGDVAIAALIAAAGSVLVGFIGLLASLKKKDKGVETDQKTYEDTAADTTTTSSGGGLAAGATSKVQMNADGTPVSQKDQSVINASKGIAQAVNLAFTAVKTAKNASRPPKTSDVPEAQVVTPPTADDDPDGVVSDADHNAAVDATITAYNQVKHLLTPEQQKAAREEEEKTHTQGDGIGDFIKEHKTTLAWAAGLGIFALMASRK